MSKQNWVLSQWGNIPPPVGGHSGAVLDLVSENPADVPDENDDDRSFKTVPHMVIFGGNADLSESRRPATMGPKTRGEKNTLLDSVYALNCHTYQWKELVARGTSPTPRYAHSCTPFLLDKMVVFGGVDVSQSQLNDLGLLDFEGQLEWKNLKINGEPPAPRYGHTMTNVNDDLVLFGGTQGGSDLWKLSIDMEGLSAEWKELSAKGTPPAPRAYHGAVATFTGKHYYLVIFGGRQVSEKGSKALNDMHVVDFDFKNNQIIWVHPKVGGSVPSPRYSHSMCVNNMLLYVFGGIAATGTSNTYEAVSDLYVFDILKQTWSRSYNIFSPLPRSRHVSATFDDKIVIFGGNDGSTWLSDLLTLNLDSETPPNSPNNNNDRSLRRTQSDMTQDELFVITTVHTVDHEHGVEETSPTSFINSSKSSLSQVGLSKSSTAFNNKSQICGPQLFNHLKNHFLPIANYKYEVGRPSHQWDTPENKQKFLTYLEELIPMVLEEIKKNSSVVKVRSPAYVLGDIHGNYKDLSFFGNSFWRFGIKLCPANILFLGDYVDRGPHSVETIGYLFALKAIAPTKVHLLRGNHETRDVNGNTSMFRDGSFRSQCIEIAGLNAGENLWENINTVFDFFPLAGLIDKKIFCVHGGIPRFKPNTNYIEELTNLSRPITDQSLDDDSNRISPFIFDLLWSDPATEEEDEEMQQRQIEFAKNVQRGGNTAIFGTTALENFCKNTKCTHIIRAHQPPNQGVQIEKSARVLTVFSSSHYCGNYNKAACVLVADSRLKIIVIKPEIYLDQSDDEIEERTTFYADPDQSTE